MSPTFDPYWLLHLTPIQRDEVVQWLLRYGVNPDNCAGFDICATYPSGVDICAYIYKIEHGSAVLDKASGKFDMDNDQRFYCLMSELPDAVRPH